MARQDDFVTEARQAASDLLSALNRLRNLQGEWNALDYGATLTAFNGANEGLTAAQIGAVVFDTTNAIDSQILDAGHATNLNRIRT